MQHLIINIHWTNEGTADKIIKGSSDRHTCQIWNYWTISFDYKTTNMGTVLLDEEFCKERRLEEKHNRRKVGGLQNSKYNLDIYKYDLVPGPLRWLQLYNYIYNLKGIQCRKLDICTG